MAKVSERPSSKRVLTWLLKHEAQRVRSYSCARAMFYRFSPHVPATKSIFVFVIRHHKNSMSKHRLRVIFPESVERKTAPDIDHEHPGRAQLDFPINGFDLVTYVWDC